MAGLRGRRSRNLFLPILQLTYLATIALSTTAEIFNRRDNRAAHPIERRTFSKIPTTLLSDAFFPPKQCRIIPLNIEYF